MFSILSYCVILVYGSKKSTGEGELLRYNELEQLLKQGNQEKSKKIDLLILSACKTAEGDNRAILGLAGLAVKAGSSSTMATLWQVGDQATVEFMKHFYNDAAATFALGADEIEHFSMPNIDNWHVRNGKGFSPKIQ